MPKHLNPRGSVLLPSKNEIIALIEKGVYSKEIAKQFNVTTTTLSRFLSSMGMNRKRGAVVKPETESRDKGVILFYLENRTLQETGNKFGVSRERIRQILNSNGIKPRRSTTIPRLSKKKKKLTSIERFWAKVDKSGGDNSCWVWIAGIAGNGYGVFSYKGKQRYAHHLSYLFTNGRSAKQWVLHSCDNPSCVNPKHLRDGSPKENVADRDMRGRSGHLKDRQGFLDKIRKGKEKLNPSLVATIKERLDKGETIAALSSYFDIGKITISRIKHGKHRACNLPENNSKNFAETC